MEHEVKKNIKCPKRWRGKTKTKSRAHTLSMTPCLGSSFWPRCVSYTAFNVRISSRLRLLFRNQRQYEVNYSVKNCIKNCSSTNPLVYWKVRQRKHRLWKEWLKINVHITNAVRKPEGAQQFKVGVWLKSNIDFKSFQTIAPSLAIEKRQWGLNETWRATKHEFKNFH